MLGLTLCLAGWSSSTAQAQGCDIASNGDSICERHDTAPTPRPPPPTTTRPLPSQRQSFKEIQDLTVQVRKNMEVLEAKAGAQMEAVQKRATPHPSGGVPQGACFAFDSASIDANEVAQWNTLMGSSPKRFNTSDSGNARSKIQGSGYKQNPCYLTQAGQIRCVRFPGQGTGTPSNKAHTMFSAGGTCDLDQGIWMKDNGPYRYGASVCLPPGSMGWVQATNWTLINQLHGFSGINPAFSLQIKKGNFIVDIHGDKRSINQISASGTAKRKYQFEESANLMKIPADNRCYTVEVALTWGSNASAQIWIDGQEVYHKSGLLIGYDGRLPAAPQWGQYTYGPIGTQELIFDKVWLQ